MLPQRDGVTKGSPQREADKKATPHKCFKTDSCEICNSDLHKNFAKYNYAYSDQQQSSCHISWK